LCWFIVKKIFRLKGKNSGINTLLYSTRTIMHRNKPEITDLLSDESFINYCKQSSPEDIAYWEKYIQQNPSQKDLIELAREQFSFLFNALAEADLAEQTLRLKNRLNKNDDATIVKMEEWTANKSRKMGKLWLKASAAAILLIAALFTIRYLIPVKYKPVKAFTTTYGERKNIQLPDGSVVNLNAGSEIYIDESFDDSARNVYLKGEAFFDVKHNANKPFIVHTSEMDVKALGTAFDVKAYQDEGVTETSLIRGSVEVTLKKDNNRTLLLQPNQKITWKRNPDKGDANKSTATRNDIVKTGDRLPEAIKVTDHGYIKEIAWKENKLVFEDDALSDVAILLERWYGVHVEFEDDSIRNYRFTGVFEKEDLQTVLDFLKESKPFNYRINNGEVLSVFLSR